MRKNAWIPLTMLLLCSLTMNDGLSLTSTSQNVKQSPLDTTTSSSGSSSPAPFTKPYAERRPMRSSDRTKIAESSASHDSEAAMLAKAQTDLETASTNDIRRILSAAIKREQRHRSFYISPGIVDAVSSGDRVRVIFDADLGLQKTEAIALLSGSRESDHFDSVRVFPLFSRAAAAVDPTALLQLIGNQTTSHIELDSIHHASLVETIPVIRADLAHQQGDDGDGTAIAILDTGIDTTHPMFAGRIVEEACFSAVSDCPNGLSQMLGTGAAAPCSLSGCGHGTRVAGIAAGNDPGGSLIGAAPHADIIAIQVFSEVDGAPGAYSSDILAGLQHALNLTSFHQIASINLSFGGSPFTSEASCDLAVSSQLTAVGLLRTAGVTTVAASGNESLTNALTTPACLSNVISVGSTSDNDVVSGFSNSASFLGLLAPGESVVTAALGGGSAVAAGTSMATPHVSGSIATIREAFPTATPGEIENALALSGAPVLDTRNGITTPRIQVIDTITLLESTIPDTGGSTTSPPSGGGGSGENTATPSSSGGGGGSCGLVGIEPFLVLGLIRWSRGKRRLSRIPPQHA